MAWIREHVVDLVPLTAIAIILVYFVLDLLEFQKFQIADAIVLFLLATISLYIISMGFKNDTSFENQETATGVLGSKIQEIDNKLTRSIIEIDTQLKDLKKETAATVRELDSQSEFYRVLNDKVMSAKSRVWLMHLDPHAPDSEIYSDSARTEYFKNCAEKAKAQNGVKNPVEFRRIINIPTMGKLEWTEKLIQETKELQNLHLAYMHIHDMESTFPVSVASCQIIDDRAVFLLNPTLNVVPEGAFKTCVIIENEKVVSVYREYYEKIWSLLEERNSKKGCIIKNGPGTSLFDKNKQRIIENINKGPLEHKEWVVET